jgi:hypothetical protein
MNTLRRVKRGMKWGLITGAAVGLGVFFFCILISQSDPISPVSLCYAFRPWWRLNTWICVGLTFLIFFFPAAFLGVAIDPPVDSSDDRKKIEEAIENYWKDRSA